MPKPWPYDTPVSPCRRILQSRPGTQACKGLRCNIRGEWAERPFSRRPELRSSEDLGSLKLPALGLRGQAVEESAYRDVLGRKLLAAHKRGEVLFWSDVEGGDPSAKGISADIKKNMRAVSVNCSGAASVSGMVRPNDHVDVIGTFDFDGAAGRRDFVTCTMLQNVLVLATGSETAKGRDRTAGLRQQYSTVTLEVTPREAEMLAFAEQLKGRIVLSLRNRGDTSYEKELPKVDFEKIRSEIEELNLKRQSQRLAVR
ncbi:MAG: Flp pilus assembly protein CpaB [Candidatus Choladocola sp.]|nr:Flp pilus assembly protein CpaB [Candidatus Choladocola sp.]